MAMTSLGPSMISWPVRASEVWIDPSVRANIWGIVPGAVTVSESAPPGPPITVSASGASGRVIELDVVSGERHTRLRGYQIRSALGLKENLFVIDVERDERGRAQTFVFTGRGWGHGVGLCQTGAYGLAKEGYSYTAILQKYYTGVRMKKVY